MKFLIFNVTVAAALVYLLTTDRTEVQNTAGRIHDAAAEIKQAASRVVDRGRSLVGRSSTGTAARPPSSADLPETPIAKPAPMIPEPTALPPMPPRITALDPPSRDEATSADTQHMEPEGPPMAAPAPAPLSRPIPSALSAKEAAALKRRAEILRGIDPAVLVPESKPDPETAKPTMTAAERRKQLYALSEEMELFYARTLGQ